MKFNSGIEKLCNISGPYANSEVQQEKLFKFLLLNCNSIKKLSTLQRSSLAGVQIIHEMIVHLFLLLRIYCTNVQSFTEGVIFVAHLVSQLPSHSLRPDLCIWTRNFLSQQLITVGPDVHNSSFN